MSSQECADDLPTPNRARVVRRRAARLGFKLVQDGSVFRLVTDDDVTVALGALSVISAELGRRDNPTPPGPAPTTSPPPGWETMIADHLLALESRGVRPSTVRLRRGQLCRLARGVRCHPEAVTAEMLVGWFGRQQHWSPEGRKSYRSAARGFFRWARKTGRLPVDPAEDHLLPVATPTATPRPTPDAVWDAAVSAAPPRTALMMRLAAEAGLRRAEVAQLHVRELLDIDGPALLVHGKGGKTRMVPISDLLAAMLRDSAAGDGYLFPNGHGGHLSAGHVGKLVQRALPPEWTMHTLRHRYATRVYRGSHDIRAVQTLLGHASVLTTQRYAAIADDEIRAAAACAW